MVTVGDILDVEVQSVTTFGLYCRAGHEDVLVLIPETSWIASYCSCHQFAEPGDRFRVQVLHTDAMSGKVSASIKALYPDPWPAGWLEVGTEHRARVVRFIESSDRCDGRPATLLELFPGAYAVLCGESKVPRGRSCTVTVVASDFSKRAVRVALTHGNDAELVGVSSGNDC